MPFTATRRFTLVVLSTVFAFAFTTPASAVIKHTVFAGYEPLVGDPDRNRIDLEFPFGTPVDQDILAVTPRLPGAEGYAATSALGRFGQLAVEGSQGRAGELTAQVLVFSDENVNTFGVPLPAQALFIIDGGSLTLQFAPGATLEFQLDIEAEIIDSSGTIIDRPHYQTGAELFIDPGVEFPTQFRQFGRDIGITYDGSGTATIPLSFQTFDLGIIPPGARIELEYFLDIRTDVPQYSEGLFFQYSDPLTVNMPGAPSLLPIIVFVPEPTSAAFVLALGASAFFARSRRRS